MIKQIRTSKFTKIVACYLAIMMFVEMTQPLRMYALTGGASQPEFNSFTPISTSDMVDLSSGDFNYNIPIMDVGGYPLNLAYNSGVGMDQEASWVGLGWDMGVGQINRQMRGLPDDFNGDKMVYENNLKTNTTIGGAVNFFISPFGAGESLSASVGMGIKYNNYDGFGASINGGLTYQVSDNMSVGLNLESSSTDGVTAAPSVSFSHKSEVTSSQNNNLNLNLGVSMNSRKGVEAVTMSASTSKTTKKEGEKAKSSENASISGSLDLNDAAFTPSKRVGMSSSNTMFSLNVEGVVFGIDPGVKFSGYRTSQGVKSSEKYKVERGFGYENTYSASPSDVLDFNREKDRTVSKNTVSLPITNYTFDLYSIQGQGVSGSFRPYRSQVGYVFDNYTRDDSFGTNLGGEIGGGEITHFGFDAAATISESSTGLWTRNNSAFSRFVEKKTGNKPNYEKVFFKNIGGFHVDQEMDIFTNKLGGYNPVTFKVNGDKFHRGTEPLYYDKYLATSKPMGSEPFIKRNKYRLSRTQSIQKLNRLEASRYGFKTKFSRYCKRGLNNNHTAEIRILKDGGEHYIYGRALYNVIKREATFDVGTTPSVDCRNGFVRYHAGSDNSKNNSQGGDQYFNRITTPAYAHTYLLTSVLSSDYEDLTGDGPTDDDLGSYTKFTHTKNKTGLYKWRVPFKKDHANYDEGLRSLNKDNKGNYQYGEKELLYIEKIETKTHVAIFTLSPRKDGHGVKDENGGRDMSDPESSKMWKLDKVSLYSKPEYLLHKDHLEDATPIKVAHFVYDYSLCKGVDNNFGERADGVTELKNQGGKLTLKKVYFTYRNSNMGKFTPYVFNYDTLNEKGQVINDNNFDYDQKGYDSWGNYKPTDPLTGCGTTDALSNAEYPFVDQSDKDKADLHASAWQLKSIDMPSGGRMELQYESDDYKYVQNRDVMEMFKVVGAGPEKEPASLDLRDPFCNLLTTGLQPNNYIYVRLDKPLTTAIGEDRDLKFKEKYLKKLGNKPVYFRFLLNMAKADLHAHDKYDYVTGYLTNLGDADAHVFEENNIQYAAIKVPVRDIQQAGFYFGRQYLSNIVHSLTGDEDVNNIEGVVKSLVNLVPQLVTIFQSPDENLRTLGTASSFVKDKSWIRLMQPDSRKFGGGSRVKELKIHDRWDVMTNNPGDERYEQAYGQQYTYTNKDGSSSGVAAYEPLGNKENPFIEPFYDKTNTRIILGPDTQNYVEMPFGECFYPSPKVTYSRVTVNNLERRKIDESQQVVILKKHATGKVVTEFYTSYDYPTISDITKIDPRYDKSDLAAILNINVKTHLTMTQGFSIHTNDMDGKMKSQWIYAEGQNDPISGTEFKYEEKAIPDNPGQLISSNEGKLNNVVATIDSEGRIQKKLVGVDYDVINDFRENNSTTDTPGVHFNTEGFAIAIIFILVPVPIPSFSHHENILRMATTTKVIHSCGILSEKIAYDAGSKVSTKNLAWDANTGEILLTETVNEYNDNYYTFNFPAYWAYDGMSQAALNLGIEWEIENRGNGVGNRYKFGKDDSIAESDYLIDGDEVYVTWGDKFRGPIDKRGFKAWVVNVNGDQFELIDKAGLKVDKFKFLNMKVVRSGHRNMPTASMASVTLMKNPITTDGNIVRLDNSNLKETIGAVPFFFNTDKEASTQRVINASAIEYKNQWASICECGLPKMKYKKVGENTVFAFEYDNTNPNELDDDIDVIQARSYNPYLYNILGDWRPVKSYAYLTGRYGASNPTPRTSGYFRDFAPYYEYDSSTGKWKITTDNALKWTFTSEVAQYSPYGQEAENKDALNRYSSALYGYNNRFPTAVANNAKYGEVASDGFEDYANSTCVSKSHFSYQDAMKPNVITISNTQAHTGKSSLRLAPDAHTKIMKKVVACGANKSAPANKTVTTVKAQKSTKK